LPFVGYAAFVIGLKLILAMVCGGAIGFERELNRKPAGLRTNVLICFGAALYMIVSRHISGGAAYTDPARLAAQVVAGIGFIGAGVILQARGSISGLTTAATIFVVGAVGIAIGEGLFAIAIFSTVLVILVLVLLRKLERAVVNKRRLFHYSFKTPEASPSLETLIAVLDSHGLRFEEYEVRELADHEHQVTFTVITSLEGNSRLVQQLGTLGTGVRSSTQG
jgi:putative Mg2+ transporter-C (MgtC) family protein